MSEYIEQFDDHLNGKLNEAAKQKLEAQLHHDSVLRKEYQFHQTIIEGIEEYGQQEFREVLLSVDEELDKEGFFSDDEEKEIITGVELAGEENFKDLLSGIDVELNEEGFFGPRVKKTAKAKRIYFRPKTLMAVAASAAALVMAITIILTNRSGALQLYKESFVILPETISNDIRLEKGEVGFVKNDAYLDTLAMTMSLYHDQNYTAFIRSSQKILNENTLRHYRDRILLYQGIAFLELKKYPEAEQAFVASEETESNYYLILTYLAQNEPVKARNYLKSLENPSSKSIELVKKLR